MHLFYLIIYVLNTNSVKERVRLPPEKCDLVFQIMVVTVFDEVTPT